MDVPATAIDPDPLDALLPRWHWRSRSTAILPTSARGVFAAVRDVTLAELPSAAARRRVDPGVTLLDDLLGQGFVPLAEPAETSLVLGRIGRSSPGGEPAAEPRGEPAADRGGVTAFDAFTALTAPGRDKALLLFAAQPLDGGDAPEALLVYEVRLWASDQRTLRALPGHWLMASWARQLTRGDLAEAVRHRLGLRRYSDLGRLGRLGRAAGP